ncbi:hypothetical protein [Peribacillus simplex]|uniref:hypothetical protein n=1 Tax=Peribacillus simplex TaxID=1478 RepID=UPI003D29989C
MSGNNGLNNRCNCHELFEGITRDRFVRVSLKSSVPVEGFFLGVFGNIVTLYDCENGCVSSKTICCEDVIAVSSFNKKTHCEGKFC